MTDELKQLMNQFADEVKPTSLHEAAVRRSRRGTRRNAGLAAVTALAVTGGAILGLNGLAFGDSNDPAPAASPAIQLDGVFYEALTTTDVSESIHQWTVDAPQRVAVASDGPENRYADTANVSPDGRYIGYITRDTLAEDGFNYLGRFMLLDVQSGEHRELGEYNTEWDSCSAPTWTADGRLFLDLGTKADDRYGFHDPQTGDFTATVDPGGCDVQIAQDENGQDLFIASRILGGDVYDINVTTADGETTTSPLREIFMESGIHIHNLTAVSDDGRFACLRTTARPSFLSDDIPDDPLRSCDYIVETATGELIMTTNENAPQDIPRVSGEFASVAALAVPGYILVAKSDNHGYQLIDFAGEVVDTIETESTGENIQLLGYVPA